MFMFYVEFFPNRLSPPSLHRFLETATDVTSSAKELILTEFFKVSLKKLENKPYF